MRWWVYLEDQDEISDELYSQDELQNLDSLQPDTLLCPEGKDEWLEAQEISELKGLFDSEESTKQPTTPSSEPSSESNESFARKTKKTAENVTEQARNVSEQVLNDEQVEKAQKMGKEAVSTAKDATGNAWKAVKLIFTDPMGGQSESINMLGSKGTLSAGLTLCLLFLLITNFYGIELYSIQTQMTEAQQELNQLQEQLGNSSATSNANSPSFFNIMLGLTTIACIPVLGIFGGFYLIDILFAEQDIGIPELTLMTGVTLLPLNLFGALSYVVGVANFELIGLFGVFAVTLTILLVYGSLIDVLKLTTRKAFFLTPVLLLVSGYITSVIARTIITSNF